ncbi:MAG: 16S rRNA (guanine(966)-N(2))-methyltransferase RsmD [Deltaproteobacteria bacterium]|nr:16S rRNA (guanine(966)-N(2))-methyltransferase RsmD [Deltaproteobacteria bacterium]MBW2128155.1 16S rRNA (guanine(966)-N(2))-methyltransferase RsmD [Deltaproteobacteria bacterium]MBW2302836.1 16S rRNA (guanine(966)-N(2))-methyltransferase RsmD [Deltaproteobacteria bacterium]
MRITGGRMKGRRLATLKGMDIRPTADKVREAMFDLLGQDMTEARVLDLFAGTGILGIEALSRGACKALFVDRSLRSVRLVRKNLRVCGFEAFSVVVKGDVSRVLKSRAILKEDRFDLVFVDPPYGKGLLPPVLELLQSAEILASPSIVVAESSKGDELPGKIGRLETAGRKYYGETKLTLYHYEDD